MEYRSTPTLQVGREQATLGSRFDPKANNFDSVRLFLALIVVFCHCYTLKGLSTDPLSAFFNYGYGGTLAVDGFLVISGFLVTRSFQQRDLTDFLLSRIARVVPGLAFVTCVEVFVIGPSFINSGFWAYFSSVGFRHLRNLTVFGLDVQMYGVFPDTNPPWMLNGSLWTIPIECSFYLLLPVLLFFRSTRLIGALFAIACLGLLVLARYGLSAQNPGPSLLTNVHAYPFVDLLAFFLSGVLAWLMRDRISFSAGPVLLCLILLYAAWQTDSSDLVLKLALPYLVLFVSIGGSFGTWLKRRIGDLSYGTYLFGFPITLTIISLLPGLSAFSTFVLAALVTLTVAFVSWHAVERPCLSFKPRRHRAALAPNRQQRET